MKTIMILAALALNACATNDYKVKTISTALDLKGNVNGQKLGLNGENEAILQEEVRAQDELRIAENVNAYFEEKIASEAAEIKRCMTDLADPRLGGRGELPAEIDYDMRPFEKVKEEFGLAEDGDLKIVRKSYYVDRLKAARSYDVSLRKMLKVVKRQHEECMFKLGIARNKAGLPSERVMAEGYFTSNGKWVETRKGENSVGDAFEIQAENKARSGAVRIEVVQPGTAYIYKPVKVDEYGNVLD
jgi:hypothetical protein